MYHISYKAYPAFCLTVSLGLVRVDGVPREHHLHGLALPDGPDQPLGAAAAGNNAQSDLGLTELGGLGGDDDVAHHGELAAAAQGVPGDRGDDGLGDAGDVGPVLEHVGHVGVDEGVGGHLLDVSPRREGLLGARDDDGAHVVVGVEGPRGVDEVVEQPVAERVESLGAVQRDEASATADLCLDVGVLCKQTFDK